MRRDGFTLVEVLLALTLLAVQLPVLVSGVSLAASLVRAGDQQLASLWVIDWRERCQP